MKLKVRNPKKQKPSSTAGTELFSNLRLPRVRRPKFADVVVFPEDITELTSQNISELLGKYTALFSYVQQELAITNRQLLALDTADKQRRNEMMRKRPGLSHIEKNKREAVFDSDEKIQEYYQRRQMNHQNRIAGEAFLAIYEKYIWALSRELTRKGTEENLGYKANLRERN